MREAMETFGERPIADSQAIELVDRTGSVIPAEVIVTEEEDEYGLRIQWADQAVFATRHDAFAAFCAAREQLSEFGLTPRCYGACRNLVVSGMASQMGGGLSGCLVELGQPARMKDLVRILDVGPDMDLVTVSEQEKFRLEWLQSLGRLS
jgi:hypothetical protein